MYTKKTDGLLLNVNTAPSTAYTGYTTNFATIQNKGLEFEIKGGIVRSKNFSWTSAFNIARNLSKLTDVNVDLFENPSQPEDPNYGVYIMGNSVVKKGEPLGLLYGYVTKGVLKTTADVEAYKAKLSPFYAQYFWPGLGVGDIQYELDDSGSPKRDVIGSAAPKFFGGFNNTFSYKNLSLSALFTFSYGNQLIYGDDNNDMKFDNAANRGKRMLGRYTAQNPNADRPRLIYQRFTPVSDMNVFDASYIKLKSITLSYNLPASLLQKIRMRNIAVYLSGYNLLTITNYPGNDPETTNDPYSTVGGYIDVSNYAPVKTYTLGVRVGF
ncbi:TonB dependent receptor [compost metagenome]